MFPLKYWGNNKIDTTFEIMVGVFSVKRCQEMKTFIQDDIICVYSLNLKRTEQREIILRLVIQTLYQT